MMDEKKNLRSNMQKKLKELEQPEYVERSSKIAQRLFSTPAWTNSKIIAITISRIPEVDTYGIIKKAWEDGKKVVVPKCHPKDRTMTFRNITAFDQLETVYYGLLEPIEKWTEEVKKDEIDLIIVPGLAFDQDGYRLGFGGGYYDRYLQDYKGKKIALAFTPQILPTIPIEKHDISVDAIVTDGEMLTINE